MTAIRTLTPSLLAIALVSCASNKAREYDTLTTPSRPSPVAQVASSASEPANPVYDTPAAYEENSTAAPAPAAPAPAGALAAASPAHAVAHTAESASVTNGPAIIHTVIKGDTLSGISKKYKTPVAAIKQANRMTNDTVVLGRKMVIPPK